MSSELFDILSSISELTKRAMLLTAPPASFYTARIDRDVCAKPPLRFKMAEQPRGIVFPDPMFGTHMMKVTSAEISREGFHMPSNSHTCAWSADSKKFYVMSMGGGVYPYALDATNFAIAPLQSVYSQAEPQFSLAAPNVLYTISGAWARTIRRYNIASNAIDDMIDLDLLGDSQVPDLGHTDETRTYVNGLLSAGDPETLMMLFGGRHQDDHYLVLLLTSGRYRLFNSLQRIGHRLHGAAVDRSARFVMLYPVNGGAVTGIPQVIVWDTLTDTCTNIARNPGGHDSLGFGVWVNQDQGILDYDGVQWQYRALDNLSVTQDLMSPVLRPKDTYNADHQSWNNARADLRVPFISGLYRSHKETRDWRALDDEIVGVATGGPSTVWRFLHHRSIDTHENFWYQPMVNVSPDGKWVLFHSNWEKTLGFDTNEGIFRTDVFLAQLKAA